MPRFPYQRVSCLSSKTFQKFKNSPIITVGILAGSSTLCKLEAYIDTGAQVCIFDSLYAKPLGIKDYKKVKSAEDIMPLYGIGGKGIHNTAYFHDLKLVIFKNTKRLKLKDAFTPIKTKIGFLETPIGVAGVLGVYGFLDQFSFKTNIPEGYFEIEPLFE